jgi:hypothetical protein
MLGATIRVQACSRNVFAHALRVRRIASLSDLVSRRRHQAPCRPAAVRTHTYFDTFARGEAFPGFPGRWRSVSVFGFGVSRKPGFSSGSRALIFTWKGVGDVGEELARPRGSKIVSTVDREAGPGRRSFLNRSLPARRDGGDRGMSSVPRRTPHHATSSPTSRTKPRFRGAAGGRVARAAGKRLLLRRDTSAVYGLSRDRSLPIGGLGEVV